MSEGNHGDDVHLVYDLFFIFAKDCASLIVREFMSRLQSI